MTDPSFLEMQPAERQAVLKRLAVTLARNAAWAAEQGDDTLEMVMRSVGTALLSVAGELARTDLGLAEDIASRAVVLITTFHLRHPQYPVGPTLH
ncbi:MULTISPECIES: hypothetical protein [unclassified Rhizobium]|uniref:hypothetical protein n=1 Tax=unclassified Rhizobium TaxID=2613769 RepID=UPI0025CC1B3E|nr:hypothetical protein [Rhizobium sp. UBA1881]